MLSYNKMMELLGRIGSKCPKCKSVNIKMDTREEECLITCLECKSSYNLKTLAGFIQENNKYNRTVEAPVRVTFYSDFASELNEKYKRLGIPVDKSYYMRVCDDLIKQVTLNSNPSCSCSPDWGSYK